LTNDTTRIEEEEEEEEEEDEEDNADDSNWEQKKLAVLTDD
jgi:hypothetical protein